MRVHILFFLPQLCLNWNNKLYFTACRERLYAHALLTLLRNLVFFFLFCFFIFVIACYILKTLEESESSAYKTKHVYSLETCILQTNIHIFSLFLLYQNFIFAFYNSSSFSMLFRGTFKFVILFKQNLIIKIARR